jgi:hypothetical protein
MTSAERHESQTTFDSATAGADSSNPILYRTATMWIHVIEVARKKSRSHDHRPEFSVTGYADSGWPCERTE